MELLSRAVFSVKCGWINPWCLTFNQPVRLLNIELRHGHKLTFALSLHHLCDVLFWRFKGLVCAQRVSKPQRGSVALCLTGTSLHIGPNPGHGPGAYVSQSRHPKPEPRSPEWRPCVPGGGARDLDVNNILFVAFNFESVHFVTDLALFLSALAGFFVSLQEMKSACPFSSNKQTAVWINKPRGSGCGPVRTVHSVRLCVCLSCKWAQGGEHPVLNVLVLNQLIMAPPHNRIVRVAQHRLYCSPKAFVLQLDQVRDG